MHPDAAVLIVLLLALVAANTPFATQRPLLLLPWVQQGGRARPAWQRWGLALALLAALAGLGWLAQGWIGQALVTGGGAQAALFLLRVVALVGAGVLLLAIPGWFLGVPYTHSKPLWHRLLELLMLYALVGALGFAFEAFLGSVFVQGWQFYVVTLSLFLVLGYPGFVLRYLLKPHKRPGGHRRPPAP